MSAAEAPEPVSAAPPAGGEAPRTRRSPRLRDLAAVVPPLLPAAWCAAALAVWGPGPARLSAAVGCALVALATAGLVLTPRRARSHGGERQATCAGEEPSRRADAEQAPAAPPCSGRGAPWSRLAWWRGRAAAPAAAVLATAPTVGYALHGETLLGLLLPGGGRGGGGAAALALALAVAPAAWCAGAWAPHTPRSLADSATRARSGVAALRPLATALTCYVAALVGALLAGWTAAPGLTGHAPGGGATVAATAALGVLIFAASLLARLGLGRVAAAGLAAAGAVELLALATASAAWLPGCDLLGRPVAALVTTHGPAAVPVLACGGAALALLVHAVLALAGAAAHEPADREPPWPPPAPHAVPAIPSSEAIPLSPPSERTRSTATMTPPPSGASAATAREGDR